MKRLHTWVDTPASLSRVASSTHVPQGGVAGHVKAHNAHVPRGLALYSSWYAVREKKNSRLSILSNNHSDTVQFIFIPQRVHFIPLDCLSMVISKKELSEHGVIVIRAQIEGGVKAVTTNGTLTIKLIEFF